MLNSLKDNRGARKKSKALGRGIGSGKGKTSARGGKGQTARSGVALNGFEGGQTPLFRRLPKRGFRSLNRFKYDLINVQDIEEILAGNKITDKKLTLENLKDLGFLSGHNSKIKLLAKGGSLSSGVEIVVHAVSSAARAVVEKAGGKVEVLP